LLSEGSIATHYCIEGAAAGPDGTRLTESFE